MRRDAVKPLTRFDFDSALVSNMIHDSEKCVSCLYIAKVLEINAEQTKW